ncbi:hypothetical protein [Halalkalicoccus tibetensis]|uniref:Uncharacterized protein n=1 Tax=Halalkalicoccus tibetensis TaxID=175632 RepID=A0ABD5V0C4_9EURY
MVTPPPASRGTGRPTASRTSATGDETPVRDYVFAALGLAIALVAVVLLAPVSFAVTGAGSLGATALVGLFVVFWLAIWVCLQTAWLWVSTA